MSKCKAHFLYNGKMAPTSHPDCLPCWMFYLENQGSGVATSSDLLASSLFVGSEVHHVLMLMMREIDLAHVEAAKANEGVRDLDRRQKR